MAKTKDKNEWGSNLSFLLAMIGSAVGLGNIWRYPYVLYSNGGGGGNGVNRTVSLTISDGSQSEGEQNNQTQQKQSQEIPASSEPKKIKRKKVQKVFRRVSPDVNVWIPIYESLWK